MPLNVKELGNSHVQKNWDEEVEGVHELFILCKGCKLKNVPTGQTTAAYISERTRNS